MEIIRCYTCNSAIGNKYANFKKELNNMKQKEENKETKNCEEVEQKDNNLLENERYFEKKSYKKIFENLEINNECCRRHFMTNISINQKEDDVYDMYHNIYPLQ